MNKLQATLFEVEVGDEIHTILEAPHTIPQTDDSVGELSFNVVMVDVSGSMGTYWPSIMQYWNEHLSSALMKEHTKLFVFGDAVYFRRTDNCLQDDDFLSQMTNLTEAIKTINVEIQSAKEMSIRLFLITDGGHNATEVQPSEEIAKLSIPSGKTVEVYLLGVDQDFPVEYSINIRSALHNGNSNVPSLFWAKRAEDAEDGWGLGDPINASIEEQIMSIAELVRMGNVKFQVSPPGHLAPGFPETESAHLGEYLYFPLPPQQISSSLRLSIADEPPFNLDLSTELMKPRYLLNKVFCQWNSLIIQQYKREGDTSAKTFEVMDSIYANMNKKMMASLQSVDTNTNSIKYRLAKKDVKFLEIEFATLMNQSKSIISLEGQYSSEIELAEKILKTTVKSKYDTKNLKMKGHGMDSYREDVKEFTEVFEKIKDSVLALPEPALDDCCRVTMGSMVKDLQDPALPDLLAEDKFTFMKTFTVTGIPIYAPVKDSSQINPWTLVIRRILSSPFAIVSHNTLELSAEVGSASLSEDKEVFLMEGDESSRFNAVVPVFTPPVAQVLEPLIRTNLFAMLATFCILKNAHIVDHSAHIAALGCAWMKLIAEFPLVNRPEFAADRISSIKTTAKLYLQRGGIAKYLKVLHSKPSQALMTESTEVFDEKTLKCESLIKPMFFFYLEHTESATNEELVNLLSLLLLELIGRCLSNYNQDSSIDCIYSHFFVPELDTKEKSEKFFTDKLEKTCSELLDSFIKTKGKLNEKYFTLEDMHRTLNLFCQEQLATRQDTAFQLSVNKVGGLRNTGSAGDVRVKSVRMFAQEMKLSEDVIESVFDDKKVFVYVLHSLQNKSSRERLTQPLPTYEEAFAKVTKLVASENESKFRQLAKTKVIADAERLWRAEFLRVHESEVVRPVTRQTLVRVASERGVAVTEDTLDRVFRHNAKTGLLRNACMVSACPFYLRPNRTFNQHIAVERTQGFPHQLHQITLEVSSKGGSAGDVIAKIVGGPYEPRNGLKAPPLPPADKVQPLDGRIGQLIKDYALFAAH